MAIFSQMKDPRRTSKGNIKHELLDIIFLVISATVSSCNDWESIEVFGESQLEWLRKYYPYKNGIPSHDTMNRVFSSLDPKVFGQYFIEWTQEICELSKGDLVAIDGKTIRKSYDKKSGKSSIHIVSAYAQKNRICLGQLQTSEKSNEITAIPELIDLLYLQGATVTIDAMGCQKKIVERIRSKNADYVIGVKNNQKALYEEIGNLFAITKPESEHVVHDVDHGRAETRKCTLINDLTFLDEKKSWEDLGSIVKIEATRFDKSTQKTTTETRFYISSHKSDAKKHNQIIRGQWSVENNLHWMLDVVFNEDSSRKRAGNSASNFNMISKVALALIERVPHKKSKRQRRFKAGFDSKFREQILNL
jgi:predicted transposase YbfD/YdcC